MANWGRVREEAPEFAARVQALFDAYRHKTIATLRADGSPRISGIEVEFTDDEVRVGMMPGSLKLRDVERDPRVAIHSGSEDPTDDDPSAWRGDAKMAGRLVPIDVSGKPGPPGAYLSLDITEVVSTRVGKPADHLFIESWHPGRGLVTRKRV